jgi:hypothetical protein
MEADNDRLEAKTRNAVVIDLDEVRARREQQKTILTKLRDPLTETATSFWLLLALVLFVGYYFLRRG